MALNTVHIRATINFGGVVVVTPYILSFNVKKERNQKSTFSASVKILATDLVNLSDSNITINAGVEGSETRIFTGDVLQSNPSPCWEDPKYVILNISGSDILHRLENEKYTRLQEYSVSKWALITGVNRKAKKGSQFKLVNHPVVEPTDGDSTTDNEKYNSYNVIDLERSAKAPSNDANAPISMKFGKVDNSNTADTSGTN